MTDEITSKEEVAVEAPIEPFSNESQDILPIFESIQVSEEPTAQIPVNEPLTIPAETSSEPEAEPISETIPEETKIVEPEIKFEPEPIPELEVKVESKKEEVKTEISESIQPESKPVEQTSETKPEPKQETKPESEQPKSIPVIIPSKSLARELLVKARSMIQFRKRKKLDKVMTLFLKKSKIINDEVEKLMHVSDATATRYLSQLEKEGKIKQTGKTGKAVFYTKI
jgi:hypothetical protein